MSARESLHADRPSAVPAMRAPRSRVTTALRGAVIAVGLIALAGCQADELGYGPKAERPLSHAIKAEMAAKKMKPSDPILVRLFKEESKLEVWKRTSTGRYALLQDYDICKWSGKLGRRRRKATARRRRASTPSARRR